MRWPGCGLRRQVPCRRRLHNPQSPRRADDQAPRRRHLPDPAAFAWTWAAPASALQNPQRPQGVASLTFSCGHAAKRGVAKAPSAQASRRTERVSRCACAGVTCAHASPLRLKQGNQQRKKRDRQRSLCSACAPASWGKSPITRMQKLSTAQEGIHKAPCAWRTPPPSRGRSPYYPYAKVISGAKSGPPCTPPHPGQAPLLPVCKSYQQCTKRPP